MTKILNIIQARGYPLVVSEDEANILTDKIMEVISDLTKDNSLNQYQYNKLNAVCSAISHPCA